MTLALDDAQLKASAQAFVETLLPWYKATARVLPWQENPTPYRVWVSEVMLQQTQVATVIAYYERWMQRFPDLKSLANASEDEVMSMWAGLGYYRRARNLKRAAEIVVRDLGGQTPMQLSEWLQLPGVGPYTAGAICAFALGQDVAAVDGNVERVLSRYFGIRGDLSGGPTRKLLLNLADAIAHCGQAATINQAMMDLGSSLCGRSPKCEQCPLSKTCFGFGHGLAQSLPEKKKRVAKRLEHRLVLRLCDVRGHMLLAHRRSDIGLLGGLWELPMIQARAQLMPELEQLKPRIVQLRENAWQTAWAELQAEPTSVLEGFSSEAGYLRHLFTHIDMRVALDLAKISANGLLLELKPTVDYDSFVWTPIELLGNYPMSTLMQRLSAQ